MASVDPVNVVRFVWDIRNAIAIQWKKWWSANWASLLKTAIVHKSTLTSDEVEGIFMKFMQPRISSIDSGLFAVFISDNNELHVFEKLNPASAVPLFSVVNVPKLRAIYKNFGGSKYAYVTQHSILTFLCARFPMGEPRKSCYTSRWSTLFRHAKKGKNGTPTRNAIAALAATHPGIEAEGTYEQLMGNHHNGANKYFKASIELVTGMLLANYLKQNCDFLLYNIRGLTINGKSKDVIVGKILLTNLVARPRMKSEVIILQKPEDRHNSPEIYWG